MQPATSQQINGAMLCYVFLDLPSPLLEYIQAFTDPSKRTASRIEKYWARKNGKERARLEGIRTYELSEEYQHHFGTEKRGTHPSCRLLILSAIPGIKRS
jgi:hypothetical protein